MSRSSAVAPIIGIAGAAAGFGLVWYMWWLAILGSVVVAVTVIARSFARNTERIIPASEVRRINEAWLDAVDRAASIPREIEMTRANEGLAKVHP